MKIRIIPLVLATILNQVQDDANRNRHSDESASWRTESIWQYSNLKIQFSN